MIKTLFFGVWVCLVALASSYFSAHMSGREKVAEAGKEAAGPIEFIKSDMISVPIIRTGKVQGYVVAQFTFAVDTAELAKLPYEPNPFLYDAAFRSLYDDQTTDFTNLQQQDLTDLTKHIAEKIDNKFGVPLARDILLNEINYVPRDEVRSNWVKKQN